MRHLLDLVAISDVVLENFTPRVSRRFGLDYANLKAVRPDLVLVSNTGYGHSGPWSAFGAMASALEPTHGSGAFMGYLEPGEDGRLSGSPTPNKIGNSYTDFLACWSAQLAIMSALYRRALTGRGTWVDLAMYQTGVSFFGEGLLDFAFNARRTRRMGNRHEYRSPHGCYSCQGDDRWVALSVRDEADWVAFCKALDRADLASDPRFANPMTRYENLDELDTLVTGWSSSRAQDDIVSVLHAHGVPAAPVLNAAQLLRDDHLRHRGLFEQVDFQQSSGAGSQSFLGRGWRLSKADTRVRGPAPDMGEANDYVLGRMLGLSPAQIEHLGNEQVIGKELSGGTRPGAVSLARQKELGWIAGYESGYDRHDESAA
jgi:crotonobetainyl-CoA:carnitine CoA-transferase CaiB-like acyl-CoA transferase